MSPLAIVILIVIILPMAVVCAMMSFYVKKGPRSRGKACSACPHYCGFGLGCDGKPRKKKG
jgi:hypothetical protein